MYKKYFCIDTNQIYKCTINKPWDQTELSDNTFNYKKKQEFKKLNDAARIIQKHCHNWLYKPICRDNTCGINLIPHVTRQRLLGLLDPC